MSDLQQNIFFAKGFFVTLWYNGKFFEKKSILKHKSVEAYSLHLVNTYSLHIVNSKF